MDNNIIEKIFKENANYQYYFSNNLLIKKFYLVKIQDLRYVLKLCESKNSELIIICHFYDTNENTVYFEGKYTLTQMKKIHKIFKMFTNISDAIDELISIFDDNYPENLNIKVKGFSYDVLVLSCMFTFINENKKDEIIFDLENTGINKPNINEYILNEISNIKEKKNKKYKIIQNLKNQNRLIFERLNILEKKCENFLLIKKIHNHNSSNILTEKDIEFLKNVFYQKYIIKNICFDLKYRATRDGEKCSDFHNKCDNIPRTLVVIKTIKGLKIGGYTEQSWLNENEKKGELKEDNQAFIFSLDNYKIYNVNNGEKAIWCHSKYGPCFYGKASFGLYMKDYLLTEPIKSNKLVENVFIGIQYDYELTNGLESTYAQEVEVFQVIMI